jgi:NTE family protein
MPRPRIGIALSSGVARGWAHIGVLRVLEKAGLRPDVVCGTSIGALVGGLYLAERMDELENWARGLTRMRLARYLDVQFGGSSLIGGRRLGRLLEDTLGNRTIESLPAPMVCVATELATGHEVWVRSGRLVDAVRASYALPGLFSPVRVDDRWLVDGALVNPIPVSVCRALGARVVIAVNLNNDGLRRDIGPDITNAEAAALIEADDPGSADGPPHLLRGLLGTLRGTPNMFSVMVDSLNIVQDRMSRSRLAADPPDVTVTPRVGHIGLLEFHRGEESIAEGEAAMLRAMPQLKAAISSMARVY